MGQHQTKLEETLALTYDSLTLKLKELDAKEIKLEREYLSNPYTLYPTDTEKQQIKDELESCRAQKALIEELLKLINDLLKLLKESDNY